MSFFYHILCSTKTVKYVFHQNLFHYFFVRIQFVLLTVYRRLGREGIIITGNKSIDKKIKTVSSRRDMFVILERFMDLYLNVEPIK